MALKTNLVGVWCEGADSTDDQHTNNYDLTAVNSPGTASGKVGTAADLEVSSSQYFSRADNADLSTGDVDFAFSVWVMIEDKTGNNQYVAAKSDASTADEFRFLWRQSTDRFRFAIVYNAGASEVGVEADALGSPSAATWYFVQCYHDAAANEIGIRVDGGSWNTQATSGNAPSDGGGGFFVGAYHSSVPLSWDGLINQLAFWKRKPSDSEFNQIRNGGSGLAFSSWDALTFMGYNIPDVISVRGLRPSIFVPGIPR